VETRGVLFFLETPSVFNFANQKQTVFCLLLILWLSLKNLI